MTDTRTAPAAMPAPALPCVRLLACPVCQPRGAYPQYVPTSWPVDVCPQCVGNPTIRAQIQSAIDNALCRWAEADDAFDAARAQASAEATAALDDLIALRAAMTDATSSAALRARYAEARQIDGLPLLAHAWKLLRATERAAAEILNHNQPRLDRLDAAIAILEDTYDTRTL